MTPIAVIKMALLEKMEICILQHYYTRQIRVREVTLFERKLQSIEQVVSA